MTSTTGSASPTPISEAVDALGAPTDRPISSDLPLEAPDARPRRRRRTIVLRFGVAFLISLLVGLAVGAGAIYAFDQQYSGRILPGVRVGSVDLSGLSADEAKTRLQQAYASMSQGEVLLASTVAQLKVAYQDIDRGPDVDAMVADALAVGRSGSTVERVVAEARTAVRGATIEPKVRFDETKLSARLQSALATIDIQPVDASVARTKTGFTVQSAKAGRTTDADSVAQKLVTALGDAAAPAQVKLDVPIVAVAPQIEDAEASGAFAAATRMATDLKLVLGKESWTIKAASIRAWLRFGPTADGGYAPSVDPAAVQKTLSAFSKSVNQAPRDASFLLGKNGKVVGVAAGRNGRKLNLAATAKAVTAALAQRAIAGGTPSITPATSVAKPTLTTEQAQATAPLMRRISSWTTYFPIWERNGWGANIWIPALEIDGTVVAPGKTFDFWNAIGPVTRAKGYRDGGVILNGHTEPQGALAGGICSCSTTLFNAALRGGMKMGARQNHYYYIDRYPKGLDATVFQSGSGSTQSMTFTNDTKYPVLIRGYKIRRGNSGYVRFELWSVPNGRTVKILDPIVRNYRPASDSVQYTSSLPAGARKRVETPVAGMDVWRTVIVYDAKGHIIRKHTYYSHYSRVTGVLLIGTGGKSASAK